MLPELGQNIGGLPKRLTWIRDLEVFDGPILSELKADRGGLYLEKWCAHDDTTVRTLIVRTDQRAVAEYLAGRLSMLELLVVSSDNTGFIVDRFGDNIKSVYLVSVSTLPEKYLPRATARHDESLRPEWDTLPQSFLLDDNWDAKRIASAERLYLDAFSFALITEPGTPTAIPSYLFRYRYDRGRPVVGAFNAIRASVASASRDSQARSVGVFAGSPGVLTIEAPSHTATRISRVLASFNENYDSYREAYRSLYAWSKLKPMRAHEVPSHAVTDLENLCEMLDVGLSKVLPAINGNGSDDLDPNDVLVAGKLVAAYYRRLLRLITPKDGIEFISASIDTHVDMRKPIDDDEDDDDDMYYDDDDSFS